MTLATFITAPASHAIAVRIYSILDAMLVSDSMLPAGDEGVFTLGEGMAITLPAGTLAAEELIYARVTADVAVVSTILDLDHGNVLVEHPLAAGSDHTFVMSEGLAIGVRAGTIDYAAIEAAERLATSALL